MFQPDMKRIRLAVPDQPEFAPIRDLDGTLTEVADPKDGYRYKRGDATYEFSASGHRADTDGIPVEVFTATGVK